MTKTPFLFTAVGLMFGLAGCGQQQRPAAFEPNLVHAMKYQIQQDVPTSQASRDATWIVEKMFGTPDNPKIPSIIADDESLAGVLSEERLKLAAGPRVGESGLYRQHCATCHGITGNGRGLTAAVLNPYPRDYRMGIFKFKSTARGSKPTREDMAILIRDGISGTAMKKIQGLTEEGVQALVDYVIYLSMRGELERSLIDGAVFDLDLEAGERLIETEFGRLFQSNKALIEKLKSINEDTDADDLIDFEKSNEFAARLKSEPTLEEKLKIEGDEGEQALKEYLLTKYKTKEQILAELNTHLDEPFEVEEETQDQLADELVEAFLDRYDDHTDLLDDFADDPEFKSQLEKAAAQTNGAELERYELYVGAWEIAEDTVASLASKWLDAENNVVEVPEPPSTIPVTDSHEQFAAFSKGEQAEALAASVKRGQELFVGKIANCSKCHGKTGAGDGQTADYDDWTKDWTSRVGLKPEDRESLIPLLARGALPPINAKPRDLVYGMFHGGASAADLYRRIVVGIEGSPMPAATFVEGQFEQDDVWHLINFVRSLYKPEPEEPAVGPQAIL